MRPLDPRLLRKAKAATRFIVGVVALAIFSTLATVGVAFGLSQFISKSFIDQIPIQDTLGYLQIALIAAIARAIVLWGQEYLGSIAAAAVKLDLRNQALEKLSILGDERVATKGTGALSQLIGPGLDALDSYFAKFLPQLVYTALITPALVVLIWSLDLESGLALVFTLPLIPLFMVMIGLFTSKVQAEQQAALGKLNGHYLEILRGATTLKIFGRIDRQLKTLHDVADEFRIRTMRVLRISFLSGFALELAASLSVALIAVAIGLRLVNGDLSLEIGLFVLLLAPEAYLPLRMVGLQFHAASEGLEVSKQVLDLLEEAPADRNARQLQLPKNKITALVGESGAGKSSALMRLAKQTKARVSWLPQKPLLIPGTVRENILCFGSEDSVELAKAVKAAAITDISLDARIGDQGIGLSGGQAQRVALARIFYHQAVNKTNYLFLDEPTASLDLKLQKRVASYLAELAKTGVTVILVTHQNSLVKIADQVVTF